MMDPTVPARVGRYTIERPLGEGGMGRLYLARDEVLGRPLAIKLIREEITDEEMRARFVQEARAAARLRHPNIVTVFDAGDHEGHPFIAMEYVEGQTLAELIRGATSLPLPTKLSLMAQLCRGLAAAHRAGLVHRDIKPANLMVDADMDLKILDFGVARVAGSDLTTYGTAIGTLNYMSPEQVTGQLVDWRSDIFAVGAVCYELLAAKQAFPGSPQDGVLYQIAHAGPAPLAEACPGLARDVIDIVEHALRPSPDDRYQELDAMGDELAAARQRLEIDAAGSRAPAPSPDEAATVMTPPSGSSPALRPVSSTRPLPRPAQEGPAAGAAAIPGRAPATGTSDDPGPGGWNLRLIAGIGGAIAVAAVVLLVSLGGPTPNEPGALPPPSETDAPPAGAVEPVLGTSPTATDGADGPERRSSAEVDGSPEAVPSPPPDAAAGPVPPASAPPASPAASQPIAADRLAELRQQAVDAFVQGDREAALDAAAAVGRLLPEDADVTALLTRLAQDAREAVDTARQSVGQTGQESAPFARGEQATAQAEAELAGGASAPGIRRLWAAEDLFHQAAALPDAPPPAARREPAESTVPASSSTLAATTSDASAGSESAGDRGDDAGDRAAVAATLVRYQAALSALDGTALAAVYPSVPSETVDSLAQYQAYAVTVSAQETQLDGARATVQAQVTLRVTTRNGIGASANGPATFQLERLGPDWIISQIDMTRVR